MTKPEPSNFILEEEKILRRIPRTIVSLSMAMALVALLLFDPLTGLFVFAGGILSALSFIWLKQSLYKLLLQGKKKALKSALALYSIRLILILGIFFIIISFFSEKIIAFVVCFSAIILVFLAETVLALTKMKKWKN
ncbi:MAG: ATP synthase subunit I [Candidatus Aminicenantes bacterium]|nr:MAG: ATP synthase subunit I [Candidatus Aminicenantes bacterium]